jgi:glycosyltransferase involved in cell wall biosynthesis
VALPGISNNSVTLKITTVIPTYRRPAMLGRAIRSVLDQSYRDVQVHVYDNASNDETAAVVERIASCDNRVIYHCHATNIGSQENFIYGLVRADTDFVHLLSDDDFLLPGFFKVAVAALTANKEAAFFSGGLLQADLQGRIVGRPCYGCNTITVYPPASLFRVLAPYTRTWTSIIFRRATIDAVGGLRANIHYSFPVDLSLRLATRFAGILSDSPVAVFTVHSGSISTAEYADIYHALLDLALFNSINEAIKLAEEDKVITPAEAAAMTDLYRTLTQRNLMMNALGFVARGEMALVVKMADVLEEAFGRKVPASMLRIAAGGDLLGTLSRSAVTTLRAARRKWTSRRPEADVAGYAGVVQARMRELA